MIRIGRYNKMTFIFSPGSSSVSKVRVVHPRVMDISRCLRNSILVIPVFKSSR